jgi:Family of unknown function (DUF6151)
LESFPSYCLTLSHRSKLMIIRTPFWSLSLLLSFLLLLAVRSIAVVACDSHSQTHSNNEENIIESKTTKTTKANMKVAAATTTAAATATTAAAVKQALSFTSACHCGKVKASINTLPEAPPLRLVCYCKDCRGYYETLTKNSGVCHTKIGKDLPSALDNWGGVDWTVVYPRDITILQGQEHLTTAKIRTNSNVRQVYTTCCHTPMFRFGGMSVLANTNTLAVPSTTSGSETPQPDLPLPVTFRIIGRDAWKVGVNPSQSKPSMSWSVPFKWFYTMPFRIRSNLMEPMPLELPDVKDCPVLDGFEEGSSTPLSP